jgi:hypothetical protein
MSKLWCACLTTDTRCPAARRVAISRSARVVLPEPEKPLRPMTFIVGKKGRHARGRWQLQPRRKAKDVSPEV